MITIGETALIEPSTQAENSDLETLVNTNIPQSDAMPWLSRAFPGRRLARIAWPTGFRPARPIKLNSYYYPYWGACRFGYGHFLCSTNQAMLIRDETWGEDGLGRPEPVELLMDTPGLSVDGEFKTMVTVLRVIPLFHVRLPGKKDYENGVCLVTVVDERFFWWYHSYPNAKAKKSDTWESIIGKCAIAVGIGGQLKFTAPSEYLKADPAICNLFGEVVPPVFDAALYNIGYRLVRPHDGKYRIDNGENEAKKHKEQQEAWSMRAGDDFFEEKI